MSRLALKELDSRVRDHPIARRILDNVHRHGISAFELYTLNGNTPGARLYFDVFSMCAWARDQGELVNMHYSRHLAEHLLMTGAIDQEHLLNVTVNATHEPVIFGRNVLAPGDVQILDGAHRYVGVCLDALSLGRDPDSLVIPAYALTSDEWRQFVIPPHIVQALEMDLELSWEGPISGEK